MDAEKSESGQEAGQMVVKKSDWLPMYREHIHDQWTPLLESLWNQCKEKWGYRVPERSAERAALRGWCEQFLKYENDFLEKVCYPSGQSFPGKGTMAANTTIWQEEATVTSSETDFQKRLKLSAFFVRMQDAASNHASHLAFGYNDMIQREIAWVLARKKVRFYDFPQMGEKIIVETWPKGVQQKLFFMRDHRMTGADGRLLAESTSAYVLVSTRNRRILMPTVLDVQVPDNGGRSAIDEALDKIPAVEELSECFTMRAGYSAVDLMGHVNNARYIDWISDCFPLEDYQAGQVDWLQINYLNEVWPGESVTLLRGQRPADAERWYITGMNQNSGLKAFEAEIQWRKSSY